jgi:arginine/ornithine N-succinyltransferase beta subunit
MARTDEISIVTDAREAAIKTIGDADGERPWALLAIDGAKSKPSFRAVGTRVIPMEDGSVGVTEDARRRLGVEDGHKVWLSFG